MGENHYELILTILSESAWTSLNRLKKDLLDRGVKIIFAGYSPWEGKWRKAIRKLRPSFFMTAKYEAWPDLWISLKEADVPLGIVSARARKSLRVVKRLCQLFSGGTPKLLLFPSIPEDVPGLLQLFPQASIQTAGEPRWDRVYSRSRVPHSRSKELIQTLQDLPRPWGVIGSAWMDDLIFLKPLLRRFSGTLWVVPHRVDAESVDTIESFLKSQNLCPIRTNGLSRGSPFSSSSSQLSCILVNEMGFLSELYSVADWAFVGGGFGAGIHSTIEPAIYGLPIAVGPNGTEKFSEVTQLRRTGQLQILRTESEGQEWADRLNVNSASFRESWILDAQGRLGATQKILATLENFI
jgi:3-deoxy-D-manno-octulosonic-acid transferase